MFKKIITKFNDAIIRKRVKKGDWLTGEQELRLFAMPECKELLAQYIKHWGLIHEEILLELNDEKLFEQYCSVNKSLYGEIVNKIFTDADKPYYAWQPICAKYLTLSPENEVIMVTSWPKSAADYIDNRRLTSKAELAMFSTRGNMELKRKYIVDKNYFLADVTVLMLLSSKVPLDGELLYAYMQRHFLESDNQQIVLVSRHNLDLLSLYFERGSRPLCKGAQVMLWEWGDKKALGAFIEHQSFFEDAEVAFVKDADADLLEKYVIKYQLSELAEIVFIERNNARLIKTYLRNHQFGDHAWQYYISLMN
ncbi:MAG: hypothetical protein J6T72_04585 [Alphaproteobacteria bacterium]|nr:hypothetical protein [Alphaproteobacteria bacterium]